MGGDSAIEGVRARQEEPVALLDPAVVDKPTVGEKPERLSLLPLAQGVCGGVQLLSRIPLAADFLEPWACFRTLGFGGIFL